MPFTRIVSCISECSVHRWTWSRRYMSCCSSSCSTTGDTSSAVPSLHSSLLVTPHSTLTISCSSSPLCRSFEHSLTFVCYCVTSSDDQITVSATGVLRLLDHVCGTCCQSIYGCVTVLNSLNGCSRPICLVFETVALCDALVRSTVYK